MNRTQNQPLPKIATSRNTKINSKNNNHTVFDASGSPIIDISWNGFNMDSVVIDPSDNLFLTNNCIEPPLKMAFNEKYKCNFKDTRQGYLLFLGDRNYKVNFI